MIAAFGERAERYARGLGDLEAVVTEPAYLRAAYLEAVERRMRGEPFYGMIVADDPRVAFAYATAPTILDQIADFDARGSAFDMLSLGTLVVGDRAAAEVWNDLPDPVVADEFRRLASALLVRSYAEFTVLTERAGGYARPVERVLVEASLPPFERVRPTGPAVVVWAPERPAAELSLHVYGLSEFLGDVVFVTAGGSGAPHGSRMVTQDDPRAAELLARAGCVVCAEPNDPGAAVAFARRGFGIVAPLTSGAHEFAPDVVVWDAADARTLHKAVVRALARPAAVRQDFPLPPRVPPAPAAPVAREDLPLVGVVIPTYNRPNDLREVLQAVAAQTYPNLEAIVVNDCGCPVDDVVAEFPFARLIEHDVNHGTIRTLHTGMLNSAADYIEFLPDDDTIYPDHVERLMFALLRSGAKIVHGNGMLRYVERTPSGAWKTTGFNGSLCADTLTPTMALIATPVSENAVIHHRSVFAEAGWWLNDSPLADLELHMRLGVRYVFVHVDQTTFEFREHAGNQAKLLDFGTELQRIYDELHPAPGRPILAAHRSETQAMMAARVPGQPAFEPTIEIS